MLKQLGFITKHSLRGNGWNDMGLTTHESLVAYVIFDQYVDVKVNRKTQNVLLC